MKQITIGFAALTLLFGACAEGPRSTTDDFGYEGTGIEFKIAPLTLDSLSDACYSFMIENEKEELVIGRGPETAGRGVTGANLNSVCASRFGNTAGGDISYVAPCDASVGAANETGTPDSKNTHTVTLWVDRLCKTSTPDITFDANGFPAASACTEIQTYVDPCLTGCELKVDCAENQDTPVTFNFTIMAQADQGFFDVAVNFDDVFCSAKLDTCGTDDQPIRLVFDEARNRMDTVVLAVSCTAGSGTADTHLTHTQLEVSCDNGAGTTIGGDIPTVHTAEGNFTHNFLRGAAYFGTESLPGANKVYSNFAFGIPTGFECDIAWQVIPTNGPFVQPGGANTYNSFGYVNFNAQNVPPGSEACKENQLNASGSAVTTVYASTNDTDTLTPVSQIGLGDDAIAATGFVTIQAGTFWMGSPNTELGRFGNEAQVNVTLTRSFFLAETEVTQRQWKAMSGGTNPSCYQTVGTEICTTANNNDTAPVEQVSWWSVFGYANALSEAQGLTPCFTLPASGCSGTWSAGDLECGDQVPGVTGGNVYACAGYRLPTEAEWEYAARAGTTTATYAGDFAGPLQVLEEFCNDSEVLLPIAWYDCNSTVVGTKAVKGKVANAWGLYDMLGNVWEWTWDRYDISLPGGTDPEQTASGLRPVRRGGDWRHNARYLRAAYRGNGGAPTGRGSNLGFRLSRSIPLPLNP